MAREVAFRSTNIQEDPEGLERLHRLGPKTVPVVVHGEAYAMGLDLAEVAKLIGIAPPDATQLAPGELIDRLENVLAATGRYLRQIPDARLGDSLPGRDRSLRELGHHVFVIGDAFLDVTRGEVLTAERLAVAPEDWMRTGTDLDLFGSGVRDRLSEWWSGCDEADCEAPAKTYYGPQTLHQVLERTAWHSAQHARQLMMVLGTLGIEPEGPLGEADLAGLPLPDSVWDDEA